MNETQSKREAIWSRLETQFALYSHGDSEVVTALFSDLKKALLGYFTVRLNQKEDVEDLTQAALLKIHFSRDRFDPDQSLKTWVFTIASRTLIDHYRAHASEETHLGKRAHSNPSESELSTGEIEGLASELLGPDQKTELNHDLNEALKTLKPIDRSIVYLYGVEGLSMAEIGQVLQTTEAAAKVRAHRAYRDLRKLLVLSLGFIFLMWEHYGRY